VPRTRLTLAPPACVTWKYYNTVEYETTRRVYTEKFAVACNADKTGATVTLMRLPVGSVVHNVLARTVTAMNGSGTKSFEVGIAGNVDKYIDTVDFKPETLDNWASMTNQAGSQDQKFDELLLAATDFVCTWTNTGGTPTAGSVVVYVTFSMDKANTTAVAVPA
jgi:hypothetical protein